MAARQNKKQILKIQPKTSLTLNAIDGKNTAVDFFKRQLLLDVRIRNKQAALRFFNKAISSNVQPSIINIDKSGSNKAAINAYNVDNNTRIEIRQCKYLNNLIEQDHRFIKRLTRPMLGFKNFYCAQKTLAGIELVRMIKKGWPCIFRGNVS